MLSSKRLLANALKTDIIQADGTYKLNWRGYPVTVFGTTDKRKKFHLIAMGFSSHEKQKDYSFFFGLIKNATSELFDKDILFEVLVSDAAGAIINGFEAIYGMQLHIMCFFHVKQNVEKKKFTNTTNKNLIAQDLKILQLCPNQEAFETASNLFCAKWATKEKEFVDNFRKSWLTKRNTWFEGMRHFTPSTNNAVEATNARIKTDFNFRKQAALSLFKQKMVDMVYRFSCEYRDGIKEFKTDIPR